MSDFIDLSRNDDESVVETTSDPNPREVEPSVGSSSSENSMQWDTAQAAECEPTYTSSFQFFPYTSAKERSRARYQRFRRTGSWDKPEQDEVSTSSSLSTSSSSKSFLHNIVIYIFTIVGILHFIHVK